jgi:hypothetical protein
MTAPAHLGDGVYAQIDTYGQFVLTTGNHDVRVADNVIYLEPEVVTALLAFIAAFQKEKS